MRTTCRAADTAGQDSRVDVRVLQTPRISTHNPTYIGQPTTLSLPSEVGDQRLIRGGETEGPVHSECAQQDLGPLTLAVTGKLTLTSPPPSRGASRRHGPSSRSRGRCKVGLRLPMRHALRCACGQGRGQGSAPLAHDGLGLRAGLTCGVDVHKDVLAPNVSSSDGPC